jgi:hypothetical protein
MITPNEARELSRVKALEDYHEAIKWFKVRMWIPIIKYIDGALRDGHGSATIHCKAADMLMTGYEETAYMRKARIGYNEEDRYIIDWAEIISNLSKLGYEVDLSCSTNYCNKRLFIRLKE